MLDKKANLSGFSYLSSKWVIKQQRQLITSKHILLMNIQCSDVSRSFARRWGMQWLAIRSWQRPIERITEAKPLTTICEAAQELIDHSIVIWHLKQTGKVKNLYNWCLMSWPKKQKNWHFAVSSSFILHNNNEPFLKWIVTCDQKWTLYHNWQQPVQWLDQEKDKTYPKVKHASKKVMITVWWSAALWFNTALWIMAKLLHLRIMLSKLKRCTKNCNSCTRHWSTEWAQFFCKTTPNELGYELLPQLPYSPNLSSTDYHFNNFLQEKYFHKQQEAGNAFLEFSESWSRFLCYRNKQTYFLLAKMWL